MDEKLEFKQFHVHQRNGILPPLRVLSCIETLTGHVMCLKGLIAATLRVHLLRLNGCVSVSTDSLIHIVYCYGLLPFKHM